MQAVYDLMGSIIIGGIILVMILGFNSNLMTGAAEQTSTTTVQQNMTTLSDIMEYDLRKMAYNMPIPSTSITLAETSRLAFQGDFDNNGSIDNLRYEIGTAWDTSYMNPQSRIIYRQLNGVRQPLSLGVTNLRFWYFDSTGSVLAANPAVATPQRIKSMRIGITMNVAVEVQPYHPTKGILAYDTTFSGLYWDRIITPKNLR